jgi:hypothetical protein
MNRPTLILSATLALLGGAHCSLAGPPEFTRELKPALLHAREDSRRTVGARFDYGLAGDLGAGAVNSEYFGRTAGTVAWNHKANRENLAAEVGASVRWIFHFGATANQPAPIDLGARFDPTAPNPPVPPAAARRPVMLKADLKVGFEADQPFDNTQSTLGPRLRLTHTQNAGLWPLLPSVHAAYHHVNVLKSGFMRHNGIPERDFWRFDVSAAWKWRPFERTGREHASLTPLGLHLDVRYFQAFELPAPARALEQEENLYRAATLSYETAGWKYVSSLYVTVARGRLPPSTREDTTVFMGVSLRQ